MKLTQVKGNTWVLEGWELIPLYKTDEHHCVLLDSGLEEEREDIEATLTAAGLTPVGILGSHVHIDHSPNHSYFQKKYHIPVALSAGEAVLCQDSFHLKGYYFVLTPEEISRQTGSSILAADVILGPEDGPVEFCGAVFQILHTPGHSPDHICVTTPDDVCYVGDCLLCGADLESKLPYAFSIQADLEAKERLCSLSCQGYILAHRGFFDRIDDLIDANRAMFEARAAQIAALIDRPMTMEQICTAVFTAFGLLTSNPFKAAVFWRNLLPFVEYLLDRGELALTARDGLRYYGPRKQ